MKRKGLLYRLRSTAARMFGVTHEDARAGLWWEVDLLLVILAGALMLGAAASLELMDPQSAPDTSARARPGEADHADPQP